MSPPLSPAARVAAARALVPGLLVTALVAMAAAFLGSHYRGSMLLFALLLGLAFHFVSEDPRCAEGIRFASGTVLRAGVALLGLRLTTEHVIALGWQTVLALAVAVALTIGIAMGAARLLGISRSLGLLIGGATAICGASAALAIASLLPRQRELGRDVTLTVVGVTTLSTVAMVIYPVLTRWLGFDDLASGQFIGATIHDVAQVVGAGYSLSTDAGDAATITKLMRVAFLMPVLVIISLTLRFRARARGGAGEGLAKTPLLPWFAVAFVLLMLVNSTGWVPAVVQSGASQLSQMFLVLAIAGVGLKTSLREITALGWQPVLLIVLATVALAAMAALYLSLYGTS